MPPWSSRHGFLFNVTAYPSGRLCLPKHIPVGCGWEVSSFTGMKPIGFPHHFYTPIFASVSLKAGSIPDSFLELLKSQNRGLHSVSGSCLTSVYWITYRGCHISTTKVSPRELAGLKSCAQKLRSSCQFRCEEEKTPSWVWNENVSKGS